MKRNVCVICLLFLITFINFAFAAKKPDWLVDIDKNCSKSEICAVGSGTSPNMAKTDARNNILKYFETNINSKFTSSLSTDEISEKSFKSEDTEEVANGILKGVKIRNTYDDGKEFYALAVLNKTVAVKEVRSDIDKIDERMKLLVAENSIKYNSQLEKLYTKRGELNKRYLILTGNMIPDVVSYEEIFAAKKNGGELSLNYYVTPLDGYGQQISNYLASILLENGAKITNDKNSANRIVNVSIDITDLYLNVDGFKKQMYSLKIISSNKSSEVIGDLYQDFVETGRSETQIKEIINMRIKDYIKENVEYLLQ